MLVLIEGHLSYEVPLVSVLEQVLSSKREGSTVLQLADPMTGARGDILINDSHVLVGAQMYEPKAMGYPALKTLCAFALADFRLVQPDAAKANRGDHSLNLEIANILALIPNLPESPDLIDSPLERIFSHAPQPSGPVEPNMARLDPQHETGVNERFDPNAPTKAEGWRALRQTSDNGQKDVATHRQEFQSLSDRIMDELPGASLRHSRDTAGAETSGRASKIKYRASNPFRDPATFLLTIVSLLKLLIPRVVLPLLLIFGLYKGGMFFYDKYKNAPPAAAGFQTQPAHSSKPVAAVAPIKNLFPRAKPKIAPVAAAAPPVEPTAPAHAAGRSKPAPIRHEAPKRVAASSPAHVKAEAAPKPPAADAPIPEYKGPSSSTGEVPKHRHAYQTVPTD